MLITRTPVRLSFAGGGTDLPAYYLRHGGAVISTTINKYFYTVLTERGDAEMQVISSDLRAMRNVRDLDTMNPQAEGLEIPLQVLKEFRCPRGVNLFLASEIPPGTGLGSSAAVCVNVIKAVSTWLGIPMSKHELAERAFAIAANRLGRPVGKQDEYAAAFGGLNLLRFGRDGACVEPLALRPGDLERLEARLMLFFTGSARDSAEILSEQRAASQRGERQVVDALDGLKALVAETAGALAGGDLDRLGDMLHAGWTLKKRISPRISNPYIDRLYGLARDAGARGGKITGAGGGGFLMLYCRPERQAAVRERLEGAGARAMHFRFDLHGATVVYDDPFFDAGGRGGTRWEFVPIAAVG
jgi:D-glycero-alpha-D-manno-heptose-7-phosphate kinase